ncbi:MAG: tetratricopeptide repeat protein, partial [Ignavibacteriales bacterium]|nr:tetratricopeptide repeat protein [Ignavibacteriales bacterium]
MKATIVFLFACASLLRAQLPSAPNALDADGLRHGEWIIYYDAEWNPVNDPDSAAFYREIVYERDKPVGPVIDRYPDGSKQWEATLLADRPEDVIHGDAIWYHDDGSVSIHAPFKNGLRHGVRKEYDENGSLLFTGGFVEDRPDGWHVRMNAEGDTLAALEYDDGVAFTLVYLFTKTHERFSAGDLDSAALYGAKALAQAERESGANSEDYGTVASDVAYVEHARGNYERAERLYRAGLEVAVAVNGEESQDAAITSNNLGILLRDLGKPEEAAPLFERVLNYVKNARGADDPRNAANYFNLAGVYRDLDRYDEATPLFDTAIILLERQEPIDSVALSWYLNDAGVAAFFGGDYAAAEARHLQAIDVKKRVLDETDPDYVLAFRNLDALYEQTGETKKRAAPLEEIARLVKLVDGETSVKYHAACNQLALVHDALGDYDRAVSVYRETATLMRDNPETKPSDYATVISNLGLTHKRRGDFGQAEYWLKESYRVRANNSGTDSPEAINALLNLGSFYGDVGMYRAAETAFLGAKRAVEANAPIDSTTHAAVISNLGYLRHQTGDYREAEELYRRSLAIKARVVGENDPDYAL